MALHRRDRVRLEQFLRKDPGLMSRAFVEAEIFPSELGTQHPAASAYVTPLTGGVTLLHMAVEFCDAEIADWLLRHKASRELRVKMGIIGEP